MPSPQFDSFPPPGEFQSSHPSPVTMKNDDARGVHCCRQATQGANMNLTDQAVEFDDLDDLYNRVKDLNSGDHIAVRSRTIQAQGVISELREDPRFHDFTASAAKHKGSFQHNDLNLFTIQRK